MTSVRLIVAFLISFLLHLYSSFSTVRMISFACALYCVAANTKNLYNICTTANIVQLLCKCFCLPGRHSERDILSAILPWHGCPYDIRFASNWAVVWGVGHGILAEIVDRLIFSSKWQIYAEPMSTAVSQHWLSISWLPDTHQPTVPEKRAPVVGIAEEIIKVSVVTIAGWWGGGRDGCLFVGGGQAPWGWGSGRPLGILSEGLVTNGSLCLAVLTYAMLLHNAQGEPGDLPTQMGANVLTSHATIVS